MPKIGSDFHCPYLEQVEPTSRSGANGTCQLIWSMPTMIRNKEPNRLPAAILQAPFYDLHQSSSANYGGIGAVIAMKSPTPLTPMEHPSMSTVALKTGGSQRLRSLYKEEKQKVIDQFDGQDSYGAKINGKLTVSRKRSRLGGIAAALEAAKKEEDFSAEEFFTNFARIWRMKARTEYMQLLASVDVHAPGKPRTNVQLPNFDEFFETFDVKRRRRHVAPEIV